MARNRMTSDDLYKRFATFYDDAAGSGLVSPPTMAFDALIPFIDDRHKTVLDLAAGSGLSGLPFHKRGLAVTCVDSSAEMLEKCSEKAFASAVLRQDLSIGEPLPFTGERFDVVVCNAGLHLMPNTDRLVAEMGRVAKHLIAITYMPGDAMRVIENDGYRGADGKMQMIETFNEDPVNIRAAFARADAGLVSTETRTAYVKANGDKVRFNVDIFKKNHPRP